MFNAAPDSRGSTRTDCPECRTPLAPLLGHLNEEPLPGCVNWPRHKAFRPGRWLLAPSGYRAEITQVGDLGIRANIEGQESWAVVHWANMVGWKPFKPRPPRGLVLPSWLFQGATIHWFARKNWRDCREHWEPIDCQVLNIRHGWVLTRNATGPKTLWFWKVEDILEKFRPCGPFSRFDLVLRDSG